jgi:acetyl-CoA carboxylase biotin carboxyl carrier protein
MKRPGENKPTGMPGAGAPAGGNDGAIDPDIVRALAEVLGSFDLTELEVEHGELRIRLARQPAPVAAPTYVAHPPGQGMMPAAVVAATPVTAVSKAEHPGVVKSPMVGTLYRRASPEAKPFVDVGSPVKAGDRVLLIEAMKTFNDIIAPRSGIITEILVEDGQPVEYGEPLLIIE